MKIIRQLEDCETCEGGGGGYDGDGRWIKCDECDGTGFTEYSTIDDRTAPNYEQDVEEEEDA